MSIVVLEAGAAGTPVLITDRCGFGEVARIGGGQVVPATVEGLRDGLIAMLGDADKLSEAGARLRKFTEAHFSWSSVVTRYVELYEGILGERR
jgi:glycosyltransferase involved in cell wall biosynthesis